MVFLFNWKAYFSNGSNMEDTFLISPSIVQSFCVKLCQFYHRHLKFNILESSFAHVTLLCVLLSKMKYFRCVT